MRGLRFAAWLGAMALAVGASGPAAEVLAGDEGGVASLAKNGDLISTTAADPAAGRFVYHVTYDLAVSIESGGAVVARVSQVRDCEDNGSGVCLNDREGNGTTSMKWNFQKIRVWAEVSTEGLVAVTDGPYPQVQVPVVVHLEGLGNRQTRIDWVGDPIPAHGPAIAVTGEQTYGAYQFPFPFSKFPALKGIAKESFKPGAPDPGERYSGYTLDEPVAHSHVYRVRGDVRVRHGAKEEWKPARLRMELRALDQIATFDGESWVDLVLSPGNLVHLDPHTVMLVSGDAIPTRMSFLEMLKGVLWAKARKDDDSLKVATPNAICGVRGTMFRVEVLEGAEPMTCVEVDEGTVETTAKDGKDTKQLVTHADGKVCLLGNRGFVRAPTKPSAPLTPVTPLVPLTPPEGPPIAPPPPSELVVEFPKGGETQDVVIAPGGTIEVLAETHGGTGASWGIAQSPSPTAATLVSGPEFVPGKSTGRLGGGGGATRWRFKAVGPQGATFSAVFELRQPWNKTALATYTLNARIGALVPKGR